MKKLISFIVLITTTLQFMNLHLFFNNTFARYPQNLVDILCVGSALSGILFGILFFRINKDVDKTTNPVIAIVLFFTIGFLFIIFNLWTIVFFMILLIFNVYFNRYKDSKSTINLVISSILSIYSIIVGTFSIGLYLLSLGISKM